MRTFDSARYPELDHRIPRSESGSNELENRVLLCGPCNRTKGNTLTLMTALRRTSGWASWRDRTSRGSPGEGIGEALDAEDDGNGER